MKYVSKCCGAGFKVVGRITMHYQCLACNDPCDIIEQATSSVKTEPEVEKEDRTELLPAIEDYVGEVVHHATYSHLKA